MDTSFALGASLWPIRPSTSSDWGGDKLENDQRWRYGLPPRNNANFAWLQHMIHHLSPRGYAGIVLY